MGEPIKVIKRICDEPMARSKGLLPCDKNCKQCHASKYWQMVKEGIGQ